MNTLRFFNLLHWLRLQFKNLCLEIKNVAPYRITDIISNNGKHSLIVQITGTGKTISYFPFEISLDEEFLKGFAIQDIKNILYLDYKEKSKPQFKIISHKFSARETLFCIQADSGVIKELSAEEISNDKEMLGSLSSLDAYRIGFLNGSENSLL